jgi:uncharacterized protein
MNRLGKILVLAGVLLAAAAIAGVAQPHLGRTATASSGTSITVTGNGAVNATPDRASFDFGVTTRAPTAAAALSRNGRQAQAVAAALRRAGVDASDIQTTEVSLWPQTRPNGTEIVGYSGSNSVRVIVPVGRSGAVVDAAVMAGADSVDGPSLDVSDRTSFYADALKKAVAQAREKALALASASGLTLGSLETVREGGGSEPMPVYTQALTAAPVPIERGTQQIQASVTVTYSAG